jgi:hypothetical protein
VIDEPLKLKNCLTISCSDGSTVELKCPPRSQLQQLRSQFVHLQSHWIEKGFSSADLFCDAAPWALMRLILDRMGGADVNLDLVDFEQLEALFLTQDRADIHSYRVDEILRFQFYIDTFVGAKILEFCRFEYRLIIQEAFKLYSDRVAEAEALEQQQTEQTAQVEGVLQVMEDAINSLQEKTLAV